MDLTMINLALVMLSTLLLTSVHTAPTGISDEVECLAERRQYPHDGTCCNMCKPGQKVSRHCMVDADDGECVHCPEGYYNNDYTGRDSCRAINPCNKSHEITVQPASADGTRDSVCDCEEGYHYTGSRQMCLKDEICPPGQGTNHGKCEVCPDETYSNENSATQKCEPQPVCSSGIIVSTGNTTHRRECGDIPTPPLTTVIVHDASVVQHGTTMMNFTTPTLPPNTSGSHSNSSMTSGSIAAVIVIPIVIIIFIIISLYCCKRKQCLCFKKATRNNRRKKYRSVPNDSMSQTNGRRKQPNGTTSSPHANGFPLDQVPGRAQNGSHSGAFTPEPVSNERTARTTGQQVAARSGAAETGNVTARVPVLNGVVGNALPNGRPISMDSPAEVGMKEIHKDTLRQLMPVFTDNLPWQQILDRMSNVFTEADCSKITTVPSYSDQDRRRELIQILLGKGPTAYSRFLEVLESPDLSPYSYLADACRDKELELECYGSGTVILNQSNCNPASVRNMSGCTVVNISPV